MEKERPAAIDARGGDHLAETADRLRMAALEFKGPDDQSRTKTPLKLSDFSSRFGVDTTFKDGHIALRIKINGEDKTLWEGTRSPENLAEAESRLKEMVAAKQKDIETRFKVKFSQENEDIERQVTKENPGGTLDRGEMIKARAPRLDELYGIEAALSHAAPSHLTKDGKESVKFYFLQEKFVSGDKGTTLANYVNKDKDGKPAVYFWPGSSDGRLITEADLKKWGSSDEFSIEALLTHELAHNSQYRLDWDKSDLLEKYSNAIGWAPYEDAITHETVWLIKGKDGDYFKLDSSTDDWLRCNKQGQLLDAAGKVAADRKNAASYPTATVREKAEIRPPTEYFDNAVEMDAEAMKMFRLGTSQRTALLKNSRALYDFIKQQDQEDINLAFGSDKQGLPHMIRRPDGTLSANSAAARKAVAEFEETNKAKE